MWDIRSTELGGQRLGVGIDGVPTDVRWPTPTTAPPYRLLPPPPPSLRSTNAWLLFLGHPYFHHMMGFAKWLNTLHRLTPCQPVLDRNSLIDIDEKLAILISIWKLMNPLHVHYKEDTLNCNKSRLSTLRWNILPLLYIQAIGELHYLRYNTVITSSLLLLINTTY